MQTLLSSWKEIAQYMGKGVRTVQRWERCQGLPVHRPAGSPKGVVLAYPSELHAWSHRYSLTQKNDALKRNRELSSELVRRAMSLNSSTRQLLESCQCAMSRMEKKPAGKRLERTQASRAA